MNSHLTQEQLATQPCSTCGNVYDKAFIVIRGGERWVFDSIECAAHGLAPACAHCGCVILGHGVESENGLFCCAYCARTEGEHGLVDRQR